MSSSSDSQTVESVSGPRLASRPGALFGIFDPAQLFFGMFLFFIVLIIAHQMALGPPRDRFIIGAGTGLLANFALALPCRLIVRATSNISTFRIERMLDASGYAPFKGDNCFAPRRWRKFQFPGQRIFVERTERGVELLGPYLVLRHIKNIL